MDEDRITPCVPGLRTTVWEVLGWLATGRSEEQIITDYPELDSEDFRLLMITPLDSDGESLCEITA